MPDLSRRSLAGAAGLLLGALALPAAAQQQVATANAAKFRVQPLTFNPEKIKWLSPQAITEHHEEYSRAVARLNAIVEQMAQLDLATAPPATVGDLKREEHLVYNSVLLRELYFECLGEAPTQPSGVFAQALTRDFGSLDRWKAEFAATGKSMIEGTGVVILAYAPHDKRLMIHAAADYAKGPVGCVPLAAMDMHEPAYKADFSSDVSKYVDSYVKMLRWTTPERLYREALRV